MATEPSKEARVLSVFWEWHIPAWSVDSCESLFLNRHRETLSPLGLLWGAADYGDQV